MLYHHYDGKDQAITQKVAGVKKVKITSAEKSSVKNGRKNVFGSKGLCINT